LQIALAHCINIKLPREEWLPVAAILTKLFLVIQNNLLSIFCYKVNYKAGANTILLGNSLNLASSLINHSCEPNMYQVSYGTTVVFRAMRPISKGEQLTFSYSKLATTSSYAERQEELYESYKFKCT
jgi:SET domain